MRLVPISCVAEGTRLGRDIQVGRADGIPLLRAGVKLTAHYLEGLRRVGLHAIYIEDSWSEGIEPVALVSEETRVQATRAVATAYASAREAVATGTPLDPEKVDALTSIVERILDELADAGNATLALADMSAVDAYTFQHSVNVAALGLLIGQRVFDERGWLDYRGMKQRSRRDERLLQLGLGLLLHDIGKLAVPSEILHKPGRLNESEWTIMKTHPRSGIELLGGGSFSPLVKSVVLRHHERWNGSGYPDGRLGTAIHEMARIAAIADVYDAVTSERVYASAEPPHVGVQVIFEGSGVGFDPELVETFGRVVAPFPPGVELKLTDGRRGIVVSAPPKALDRPVVRIIDGSDAPYEVSLLDNPSLRIAGWELDLASAAAA